MEDLAQIVKNLEKRVIAAELKTKTLKNEIFKELNITREVGNQRVSILASGSKSPERKRMSVMSTDGFSQVLIGQGVNEKDLVIMKANLEANMEKKIIALEERRNSSRGATLDSLLEGLKLRFFKYAEDSVEKTKALILERLDKFEKKIGECRDQDLRSLSLKAPNIDLIRANDDIREIKRSIDLNHEYTKKNFARISDSLLFCEDSLALKISRVEHDTKSEDVSTQIHGLQQTIDVLEKECRRRFEPLEKQLRGEIEYEDAILEMKRRFLDMGKELDVNYKNLFEKMKDLQTELFYKASNSDMLEISDRKANNEYVVYCEETLERLQRQCAQTALLLHNFLKTSIKSNDNSSTAAKNSHRIAIQSQLQSLLQYIQKDITATKKGHSLKSGKKIRINNLSFDEVRRQSLEDDLSDAGGAIIAKPPGSPKAGSARGPQKHNSLSANQSSNTELLNVTASTKTRSRSPELTPFLVKNSMNSKPASILQKGRDANVDPPKVMGNPGNDSLPRLLSNMDNDNSNISSTRDMINLISLKGTNTKGTQGVIKGKKGLDPRIRGLVNRAFPVEKTLSANNSFV